MTHKLFAVFGDKNRKHTFGSEDEGLFFLSEITSSGRLSHEVSFIEKVENECFMVECVSINETPYIVYLYENGELHGRRIEHEKVTGLTMKPAGMQSLITRLPKLAGRHKIFYDRVGQAFIYYTINDTVSGVNHYWCPLTSPGGATHRPEGYSMVMIHETFDYRKKIRPFFCSDTTQNLILWQDQSHSVRVGSWNLVGDVMRVDTDLTLLTLELNCVHINVVNYQSERFLIAIAERNGKATTLLGQVSGDNELVHPPTYTYIDFEITRRHRIVTFMDGRYLYLMFNAEQKGSQKYRNVIYRADLAVGAEPTLVKVSDDRAERAFNSTCWCKVESD